MSMNIRELVNKDYLNRRLLLKTGFTLLCILAVLLIITSAGSHFGNAYSNESLRQMEDTVRQYAVQCYALEGEYPESLDYLVDNYMLTLNEDEYVYHYKFIGSNMMPDITVFPAM